MGGGWAGEGGVSGRGRWAAGGQLYLPLGHRE